MTHPKFIIPHWPAPPHIKAVTTTRLQGNLALQVGDEVSRVETNRAALQQALALPTSPTWLNQVHGTTVLALNQPERTTTADAAYSQAPHHICAILTADCLPLLITDRKGQEIAAIHAGWRGLAAGIVDRAV